MTGFYKKAKSRTEKNAKDKFSKLVEEELKEIETKTKDGDGGKAFEKLCARLRCFREYSSHNACLIVAQNPEATHVAGKKTFEAMGGVLKDDAEPLYIYGVDYRINRDNKEINTWLSQCPTLAFSDLFPKGDSSGKYLYGWNAKGKDTSSWCYPPKFPPYSVVEQIRMRKDGEDFVERWYDWQKRLSKIRKFSFGKDKGKTKTVPPTSKYFIQLPVYDISSFDGIEKESEKFYEPVANVADALEILYEGFPEERDAAEDDNAIHEIRRICGNIAVSGNKYEKVAEKHRNLYGEIAAHVVCSALGVDLPYSIDVMASQWKKPKDILKDAGKISRIVNVVMDKAEPLLLIKNDIEISQEVETHSVRTREKDRTPVFFDIPGGL